MNPETPLNCEDAQQLLSDAMAGEADDAALERLDAHLETCDACKLISVKLFRQDRALSEMGAAENVKSLRAKIRTHLELPQQAPNKKKSKIHKFRIRPRNPQSSFWSITAGIAALLVVSVLVVFYMGKNQNSFLAKLNSYDGTPTVTRNGKHIEVSVNLELQSGDLLEIPASSHAELVFAVDEVAAGEKYHSQNPNLRHSALTLDPMTSLQLDDSKSGQQVALKTGTLNAQIAPQMPGKHFVINTPGARVEVVGTKFQVNAKPDETQLLVDHGKVKFSRVSDKAEVEVVDNHYAVAKENVPLVALAKQEQLTNPAKEQRKRLVTVAEYTEFKKLAAEHLDAVKAVVQTFKPDTFTQGKTTIPYRLFSPETVMPDTKFPLVIFLHGIGGNGKDNLKQLTDVPFGPGVWALAENQARHPCFVLAPQVNNWDPNSAQVVMELIDELIKKNPIDARRVYVTGVSSGAYGTYLLLQARPKFFAAALPVSGWIPDTKKMNTYAHVPLWIFHGEQDKTINPGNSRKAFDDFSTLSADVRFDEYEKAGHGIFEEVYSQPELMEWVFRRSL